MGADDFIFFFFFLLGGGSTRHWGPQYPPIVYTEFYHTYPKKLPMRRAEKGER